MKDNIKTYYTDEEFKDFKDDLNILPYWIKSEEDLKDYCKHMTFRLIQITEMNRFYERNIQLTPELENQLLQIHVKFDAMFYQMEKG